MANSAESEAKECVTFLAKNTKASANNESKREVQKIKQNPNRTEQNEKGDRSSLNFYINCYMHSVYSEERKAKQMEMAASRFGKS